MNRSRRYPNGFQAISIQIMNVKQIQTAQIAIHPERKKKKTKAINKTNKEDKSNEMKSREEE